MLWFSVGLARQTVKASHPFFPCSDATSSYFWVHVFTYCCIDQCASRNLPQRVSSVCDIIYWSYTMYLLFRFASIFQFLQWFRFNSANLCVILTTVLTCLLLLLKLLFFFFNPPLLNSKRLNLMKGLDVFYTHAQHSAQIKVCCTEWRAVFVSHWDGREETIKIYYLSNHRNPLWFAKVYNCCVAITSVSVCVIAHVQ